MESLIYLMDMKISNLGLQAFLQTTQTLNVTTAAKELGLTQSALSQRISQLEAELEVTLFIREARGLKLTEAGERLLRFTLLNQKLEEEVLHELKGSITELAGNIRLAAYSSIMRSVIIPALTPFILKHPAVQVSFQTYEMDELEGVLQTASADIIFTDYVWDKKGIRSSSLGEEEYVVIESKNHESSGSLYLDHGPNDKATIEFFKQQAKAPKVLKRSFMGDVYGIIDGVENGLGRAVMSKHLIITNKKIKVLKNYHGMKRPVKMYYFEQPYYSRLMKIVLAELESKTKIYLSTSK
jgi:DNA-binding transcriptional LysR family regulator